MEGVDEKYLSYALKFRTFGNMTQKLWPNIFLLGVHVWAIGAYWKKTCFSKMKI